ncbi:HlyD family efflux transporter periplasmic adaptor subunit [Niastella caeni]|uniref:HlyD family efflux transporter periplasmic adaptor subunit n=1 Tax=Niastella caeni TaxID=2569763 RepID=A0A4S8HKU8_9BACT|nr:HlyD family efflux transporter periplasmic adaptor subunit [Niastella caeni]THU34979.1 HlyD family efflux transporter periplasmic adaptor subunit [Niastella caeni]
MPQTSSSEITVNYEVNEILGATPGFFVRTGNFLLLGLVAIAMALSAIITYPDVITGAVSVNPYRVVQLKSPPAETTIAAIQVKEGDTVAAGDQLLTLTDMNNGTMHVLCAPTAGVVFFQRMLPLNDLVEPGALLLYIQDLSGRYKVKIRTSHYGSGKIHKGQKVYISLDKFPRDEFGELTARVISNPFSDSLGVVLVDAVLTKDIATTYGRHPDLGLGAAGTASIVTGRKSFFSRLFP